MNPIEKILMHAVQIELGIIPMSSGNIHHDFGRILETLSAAEARKAKRKFRKLWRSFVLQDTKNRSRKYAATAAGLGKLNPTRSQKNARKYEVYSQVLTRSVRPIVQEKLCK